jgi:hypothetical protein
MLSQNEVKNAVFLNHVVIPALRELFPKDKGPQPHDFTGGQPKGTKWRYELKGTGVRVFYPLSFDSSARKKFERKLTEAGWHIAEDQQLTEAGTMMLRPLEGRPVKNIPLTIFHMTFEENAQSIQQKGIQARSSGGGEEAAQGPFQFKYPKRSFFFTAFDKKDVRDMALMLSVAKGKEGQFRVFSVDTSKIKNHTFFRDPDSAGIYTDKDIPKEAISGTVWTGKV